MLTKGTKDENIKDCVIIANTTQLEMMDDDAEPKCTAIM